MSAIAVILARSGSKGVPGKNRAIVGGRVCVSWTIDFAKQSKHVERVVLSSDDPDLLQLAMSSGVDVVLRPMSLATDTASVEDSVRHAVESVGWRDGPIAVLYGNVPVRPADLLDRALDLMTSTGADSVQSYSSVGKHHPWWTVRIGDDGATSAWEGDVINNGVDRRQDLPEAFTPDGGVLVVSCDSLFHRVAGAAAGPHQFLGVDCRAVVSPAGAVIDIDEPIDLVVADAMLRESRQNRYGRYALEHRAMTAPWRVERELPYIIAEIGVDHDGERAKALRLVDAAADAGADAVKVQFFTADALVGDRAALTRAQRESGESDAGAMLSRLELPIADLRAIAVRAGERGLDPIATVFNPALVAEAESVDWAAYKTASPDIIHRPLLDALKNTGRPLIVSTGASEPEEIARAAHWLVDAMGRTAFLQCVSCYPAPAASASLGAIDDVRQIVERAGGRTEVTIGYSDHTTDVETGALARACGATILEKHITYDRCASGPDHATSLDPAQLGHYVRLARQGRPFDGCDPRIGDATKRVLDCEREVRRLCRQSIVVRRDVRAGETLTEDMLAFARPGDGIPPFMTGAIVGAQLARGLVAGKRVESADLLERVS